MSKSCIFEFRGKVIIITIPDVKRYMSEKEVEVTSINLEDHEQAEAIFDLICSEMSGLTHEEGDEIGRMKPAEYNALFTFQE